MLTKLAGHPSSITAKIKYVLSFEQAGDHLVEQIQTHIVDMERTWNMVCRAVVIYIDTATQPDDHRRL